MKVVVDSGGRVVLPKPFREALGLTPGSTVDISRYGSGLQLTPGGRTAQLMREADCRLVSRGETIVSDEAMFTIIDAGRR